MDIWERKIPERQTWSEKRLVWVLSAACADSMQTAVAGTRLRDIGNEVT